jgi:hypothetical protein
MKEQAGLSEELSISETRMEKLQLTQLLQELELLTEQVDEAETELDEAKTRLDQTVISADVVEEVFDIAEYSNIIIMNITSTPISDDAVEDVELYATAISASVTGELYDIIDFVTNLNNGLSTGYISSVQISIPESEALDEVLTSASIQITVYSYEEK